MKQEGHAKDHINVRIHIHNTISKDVVTSVPLWIPTNPAWQTFWEESQVFSSENEAVYHFKSHDMELKKHRYRMMEVTANVSPGSLASFPFRNDCNQYPEKAIW